MGIRKRKQCRLNPAGFFMNVKTAKPFLSRNKATVVYFAAMVQTNAHQNKKVKVVVKNEQKN